MSRVARRPISRIFHLDAQLFQGLPLTVVTSAEAEERAVLLQNTDADAERSAKASATTMAHRVPQIALAVGATACACLTVVVLLIVVLSYRRIDAVVSSIDGAVGIHQATTSMIRNVDSILNSSAAIAGVVHKLGLTGIDASVFSKPFLTRLLNTTASIADDAHAILDHPKISIG